MLICVVHTSLPVTTNLLSVQWIHRGSLVNSTEKIKQEGNAPVYVTKLSQLTATVNSSGLYSCHVSTDRQQVTAEANLTVACEWIELNCHHLIVSYSFSY